MFRIVFLKKLYMDFSNDPTSALSLSLPALLLPLNSGDCPLIVSTLKYNTVYSFVRCMKQITIKCTAVVIGFDALWRNQGLLGDAVRHCGPVK